MKTQLRDIITPEYMAKSLQEGRSVEEIVSPVCSRSRGYQLLKEYQQTYPDLFPPKKTNLTKETLSTYLKNKSIQEAALYFGVSVNTIRNRMREWNLQKTMLKEKLQKDLEQIRSWVQEGKTDEEIAKAYGCSVHTIMKIRYEENIYRRKSS